MARAGMGGIHDNCTYREFSGTRYVAHFLTRYLSHLSSQAGTESQNLKVGGKTGRLVIDEPALPPARVG